MLYEKHTNKLQTRFNGLCIFPENTSNVIILSGSRADFMCSVEKYMS